MTSFSHSSTILLGDEMMQKKLIISALIIMIVCTGTVIVSELLSVRQPPALEFSAVQETSEYFFTNETSGTALPSSEELPETADTVPADSSTEQNDTVSLYTSHDPLHGFCITFEDGSIEVSGIYNGDAVTGISLSDKSPTKVQYLGNRIYAEVNTVDVEDADKLMLHFDSGWTLPVFVTRDANGSLRPLVTDAAERSQAALEHPIVIPQENVAEYIVTDGDTDERTAVLAQVKDISDKVCEGLVSDYDKARALSMWVARNIYYDYVAFETEVTVQTLSLARTLELQRSVCGGYANLYAALCQAQGISCHVVKGTVIRGGGSFAEDGHETSSHEWNVIELDGRHIWVDTLWNTTNGYDGEYYTGYQTYRYFDISDECMAINHRAERVEIRRFY